MQTVKSNIGPRANFTLDRMMTRKMEEIKLAGERITRRVADVNRTIEERGADANLNSLGELQSLGTEYDRLIAELCAIRSTASELVNAMMTDSERAAQS